MVCTPTCRMGAASEARLCNTVLAPPGVVFAAAAVRRTRSAAVAPSLARGRAVLGSALPDTAAATLAVATVAVAAGCARASRRRRGLPGGNIRHVNADSSSTALGAGVLDAAGACVPPELGAADVTGEKKPKAMTAQQLVKGLFVQGKKSAFSPNAWYESPETTTNSQVRVWQHWQVRPTRRIDRICEGSRSCGCTWTQLDGRRGASYFRFDQDGKITFVREVPEPDGWRKFKTNNMNSLKPVFNVMGTIQNVFSFADQYLNVGDRQPLRPRFGMAEPRTRRAEDVVRYLWEEAFCAEDGANRAAAEYSEAAVYEDMTYVEEAWAKGKEAVGKYFAETKANAPENLRFVLDELSDGNRSCTALWHVEYGGQKSPRGVSFYELDEAGKVKYVRASYDLTF